MTTLTSSPPTSRKSRNAERTRCSPSQSEALFSQHLATTFLVCGCERALFDLRCSLGGASNSREVRVGLEAADLLEEVLAGWRDTLRLLREAGASAELLPSVDPR